MSDEVLESLADAITYHANAINELNKTLNEFLKCSCSVNALGNTATHPTIVIKRED